MGFNHVVTLQDLDYPSAQRIQQLQSMLDGSGAHLLFGCGALTALPVECGARVLWETIRTLPLTLWRTEHWHTPRAALYGHTQARRCSTSRWGMCPPARVT
jgi:hypothetical protein